MSNMGRTTNEFYMNPVLPGFYPDPSICRVGEDYYMVTSTFTYFPGIPVFHSRDLVHWKQIGHALDRPSQLDLDGLPQSKGIFAPTIRYHNNVFYIITTNNGKGGNFVVTASDPAGPWSEPFLLDAPGIDPSLFFDDDGKCYYTGTRPVPEGPRYNGNWEIFLQEMDLKSMSLKGEACPLWRGAMKDAVWPEGPHIYKVEGAYYLMIAEGGTGHNHAITIARSRNAIGPYEGNPGNPILTHRHLGKNYPIVNTGHGDLIETQNGEWWMVLLASRPYGGYFRNMGRETFLVPVVWEDGWPVASPGTGRVEFSYPVPDLPRCTISPAPSTDHFDSGVLDLCWNFIRTPRGSFYSLNERKGYLALKLRPEKITQLINPSFVGRRQRHMCFAARAAMDFEPECEGDEAGLVLFQSNEYHYRFTCTKRNGIKIIQLIKCEACKEEVLSIKACPAGELVLKIEANFQDYRFLFGLRHENEYVLLNTADGRILSTDIAGGFIGTYIGMYASGNGAESNNSAFFDWFEYAPAL